MTSHSVAHAPVNGHQTPIPAHSHDHAESHSSGAHGHSHAHGGGAGHEGHGHAHGPTMFIPSMKHIFAHPPATTTTYLVDPTSSSSPSSTTSPRSQQDLLEIMKQRLEEGRQHGGHTHHALQQNHGLIHAPLADERSILHMNPPIIHGTSGAPSSSSSPSSPTASYDSLYAPTPFAAPSLDAQTAFLASVGNQQSHGSIGALNPQLLAHRSVQVVVEHPMIFAVKAQDINRVQELLTAGVVPHCIDAEGHTALHWSCRCPGKADVLPGAITELLLKYGAPSDFRNKQGDLPIHWAASAGHMRSARALIAASSFTSVHPLQILDSNGWTCWIRAAQAGKTLFLDFLLQQFPNSNTNANSTADEETFDTTMMHQRDLKGKNAMHWAAYNDNSQLVEWLLENGGERLMFDRDSENALPIHWAALKGNKGIVEVLLVHASRASASTSTSRSRAPSAPNIGLNSSARGLLASESASEQEREGLVYGASPAPLSKSNSSTSSSLDPLVDPLAHQLFSTDETGMDVLSLAIDKRERTLKQIEQQRLQLERQEELEMRRVNPNGNAVIHSAASAASHLSGGGDFNLRAYTWQWLCCLYPLILFLLSIIGILQPLQSRLRSMYENCRKGIGMTYSAEYEAALKKQSEDQKLVKALERTISVVRSFRRWFNIQQLLGLRRPTNPFTKLVALVISKFEWPTQGWIISRWLGFIMISGGYCFYTHFWPLLNDGQHRWIEISFLLAWTTMVITFIQAVSGDPGYVLPRGGKSGSRSHGSARGSSRFTGLRSEYTRILSTAADSESLNVCTACRIYRTPRSKHCRMCGTCTDRFDHHCPWISNCVGAKNHRMFMFFLASANLTIILLFVSAGIYYVNLPPPPSDISHTFLGFPTLASLFPSLSVEPWFFAWIIHYVIYLVLLSSLLNQHLNLIAGNLTINEAVNWYKYPSFQNAHGNFDNPYDEGARRNCTKFFFQSAEANIPSIPHLEPSEIATSTSSGPIELVVQSDGASKVV